MSDERYFCVHCQEADVQRSDEDRCCLRGWATLVGRFTREQLHRAIIDRWGHLF